LIISNTNYQSPGLKSNTAVRKWPAWSGAPLKDLALQRLQGFPHGQRRDRFH